MNQYKQEYMTEFGYILGTMQKEYGNIIDKFPPKLTENQDGIKIFNEFVEFFVDKFLSSNSRDYEEFIKNHIEETKKEFVNLDRTDKWKNVHNITLKYYYELEPSERNHLPEFSILSSINSILEKPELEIQERLLNVVYDVWLKDENHINESKISDEICKAYKNKQISLESLEEANSRDLLQCALGYDSFSDYNTNPIEQYEYIEHLYNQAMDTDYKNQESNVVIIDQGIIIGSAKDIIEYLVDENNYLKETKQAESCETLIRNNEIVMKEIKEDIQIETIMGIKYDKEFGIYNVMQNEEIIDELEDIVEEYQEEDYEEEQE